MGNILGDPFEGYVKDQIDVRQNSLGKINIPEQDYLHYTTKAPFIRLASSVNLTKLSDASVLSKLSKVFNENDLINDNLAKNFILQGGVVKDESEFSNLLGGLNNGDTFSGAYGWGGIEERGYVPLPGITNANVTYYNNGALSKTTIDIRCYSRKQFQLLDALYLRPGYTLLLEFGHSQYLNNRGELETFPQFKTTPMREFLEGGKDQYELYSLIDIEKESYYGNYEAVLGKITNFSWQFLPDGSYSCQQSVYLSFVGQI